MIFWWDLTSHQTLLLVTFLLLSISWSLLSNSYFVKTRVSPEDEVNCVPWLSNTRSDVQVQGNFRTAFNPSRFTTRYWHKTFIGSVLHQEGDEEQLRKRRTGS